jgi:BlaI family transcriptional regulator, penicillinase repressor
MPLPNPTPGEMAILRVLWDRGPSTIKDIHHALAEAKETAYTTVLRMCQIMVEKSLLSRDDSERQHVYAPLLSEAEAQSGLLDDLLAKAFRGSSTTLVLRALSDSRPDGAELREIQAFLEGLQQKKLP